MMHNNLRIPNRTRTRILFLTFCLVWAFRSTYAPANEMPPNVVFILVDDLGWADLGCYGADLHESPHLDRFARQAVRFTQAYAASPVCTPTRASIMTGKFPARLKMTIWHEASANPPQNRRLVPPVTIGNLPLDEVTLAEALRSAGYTTAHIGKWHLGDAAHYPENQGFDLNIGGTFWGAPATFFHPYRGLFGRAREPRYVPGLEGGTAGEYLTDRLTDEALEFIEQAGGKPFFLHLAYHTVHTPIEAKQPAVKRYRNKLKPEHHHQNATYAAMVESLDENAGRVLAKLDELQLARDTLVIFTSDNGGFVNRYREMPMVTSNKPLRSGKGSLYEGGVRVPLIVRWPGETVAGSECDEPVASIDFYATILDAVGVKAEVVQNASVDGLSLVPLLKDSSATLERDELCFHYPHYYPTTTPVSSIRRGDWKLIEFLETGRVELFNLTHDLGEANDVSEQMPQLARELKNRLDSWRAAVDAQMPKPNAKFPGN